MLQPSIDSLMTKINSKYTLVTVSAHRARQLREKPELFQKADDSKSVNYVGMALEEIESEKLTYEIRDKKETT
ncbi:DNA-directed RNA polymerase subunit omega [Salipaludibacillus sp. CUR1]|uniref:DNA-directed RNA polymerase subunit omega n=1 Tax=Salipaludibacillus aurantiacus TaxID=1601833 RepID=A0A1H9QQG4_9BACI|nr:MULTISPECIES: DNA-directed RNA polymerase subunit omega [Salipaludibacillus]MCE7794662.1 DNA-directed RNA polymerase subunit omega [Salipaludibacillus sp. CUR1]SER62702.1 DNA-directed RNA polymerase subunit omega [Salipaludibacillus aurantiacus]